MNNLKYFLSSVAWVINRKKIPFFYLFRIREILILHMIPEFLGSIVWPDERYSSLALTNIRTNQYFQVFLIINGIHLSERDTIFF